MCPPQPSPVPEPPEEVAAAGGSPGASPATSSPIAGASGPDPQSAARFPFATTPEGWYQVAQLDDLPPGAVQPLHCFGEDLVAWRTESGDVRVSGAHCPHLGAHLGYGGQVTAEGIVCPFHGWCFDESGANVAIPYSDRTNGRARLAIRPTQVANGLAFVWHGPEGREPSWPVPELPEATDEGRVRVAHPRVRIRTHVQEVVENVVDVAHFGFVHRTAGFGGATVDADGPVLRADAAVSFVTPRGPVEGSVVSELWGLGIDIVRPRGLVDAAAVFAVTPVDDGVVEAGFTFFLPRDPRTGGPTRAGLAMAQDFEKQLRQDIPIWEHKRYRADPALAKGDGPILRFRRWAAQFHGPDEPTAGGAAGAGARGL